MNSKNMAFAAAVAIVIVSLGASYMLVPRNGSENAESSQSELDRAGLKPAHVVQSDGENIRRVYQGVITELAPSSIILRQSGREYRFSFESSEPPIFLLGTGPNDGHAISYTDLTNEQLAEIPVMYLFTTESLVDGNIRVTYAVLDLPNIDIPSEPYQP